MFTGSFEHVQCGIVGSISMEVSQTKFRTTLRCETIFMKRQPEGCGVDHRIESIEVD